MKEEEKKRITDCFHHKYCEKGVKFHDDMKKD